MIDKLIKAIEKAADSDDMRCDYLLLSYCEGTDCNECVFEKCRLDIILSELKELQEMKRHVELIKKVYGGKIAGMEVKESDGK